MSKRSPGSSVGPCAGFNVGDHVGDDPLAVARHRQEFESALGAPALWLQQVHGVRCVAAHEALGGATSQPLQADAAWTDQAGVGCVVMVADCLPVLFARRDGAVVAAAHAGWRGLAAGVLRQTVKALCEATGSSPADIRAWLGPCIGPQHFEVGEDVVQAFGGGPHFQPRAASLGPSKYLADLPALAADDLRAVGLHDLSFSRECTFGQVDRYFSHRRDGARQATGRMAAGIARG